MHPHAQNWLSRIPNAKDFIYFRELRELHRITEEWTVELKSPELPELKDQIALARKNQLPGSDHLWVFEVWDERPLEDLIDDLSVQGFLAEIEMAIHSLQKQALSIALDQKPQDSEAFKITLSRLEQASWKSGRRAAEALWKNTSPRLLTDLKSVFLCTLENATHPGKGLYAYVLNRVAEKHIELDLIDCHHVTELCLLHFHWLKGFVYGLNPTVQIEQKGHPRCHQTWTQV